MWESELWVVCHLDSASRGFMEMEENNMGSCFPGSHLHHQRHELVSCVHVCDDVHVALVAQAKLCL